MMRGLAPAAICLAALAFVAVSQRDASAPPDVGAKTWIGHYGEVEDYLKTAECVGLEDLPRAVAGARRCVLRPGGPVARMIWKPFTPVVHSGFRERMKGEIAAYTLDRLLNLDMIPPVVER